MLDAAIAAINEMFSKPFRAVFYKTLGLTIALLAVAGFGLDRLVLSRVIVILPSAWMQTIFVWLSGLGLMVGLVFLVPAVSFIVASFFFDELAAVVERDIAPPGALGRPLPYGEAMWLGLRFAGLSLLVNIGALLLLLVPGVNAVVFIGANAYLLGRGYFELAATRYLPLSEVHLLRRAEAPRLFVAGLLMALLLGVPILNLLGPLFCTAFMVRITSAILVKRVFPFSQPF
nr:sulfate transporter family protein [Beijerinckia indica]